MQCLLLRNGLRVGVFCFHFAFLRVVITIVYHRRLLLVKTRKTKGKKGKHFVEKTVKKTRIPADIKDEVKKYHIIEKML